MTTRTVVVTTDEFAAWYRALPEEQSDLVDFSVALLEEAGVALRHPHSSGLPGSGGLRELRIQSRRHPIRVFYAFNPARQAVLIIGGDKKGEHDESAWTQRMAAEAQRIWAQYLAEKGWEKDPG